MVYGGRQGAENAYAVDQITDSVPHTDSNSKDITSYFVEYKSATGAGLDKAIDYK